MEFSTRNAKNAKTWHSPNFTQNGEIHQKWRNFTKNVIITQKGPKIPNYLPTPSQGYGLGAESGEFHLKREIINNSPIIGEI